MMSLTWLALNLVEYKTITIKKVLLRLGRWLSVKNTGSVPSTHGG